MRQLIIAFTTLLAAAMLVSCEHNYSVKGYKNLPPEAKSTIENHFPGIDVIRVETDHDDGKITYDVTLSNGIEIEFDSDGRWTDIDGNRATSLPDGLIPAQILEYVNQNFAGAKITGIDRRYRGYEVELDNGVELKFDVCVPNPAILRTSCFRPPLIGQRKRRLHWCNLRGCH